MSTNVSQDKENQNVTAALTDAGQSSKQGLASRSYREILHRRVLDLLGDPDPVRGIYAMYGSHGRHPPCIPEK